MIRIERIISGGQTGADRGGLDAAIALGIPHGGSCPKDRRAEDGRVPDKYQLTELKSRNYRVRTGVNVIGSDATVVFTWGAAGPGSGLTLRQCVQHYKPHIHVNLQERSPEQAATLVRRWLATIGHTRSTITLNVAGSREQERELGICGFQRLVEKVLVMVLSQSGTR